MSYLVVVASSNCAVQCAEKACAFKYCSIGHPIFHTAQKTKTITTTTIKYHLYSRLYTYLGLYIQTVSYSTNKRESNLQMDLQFMRKVSISSTIWFTLFLATIITNVISRLTTQAIITWSVYSILIGVAFLSLKIWNKSLQEPLLDVNLTYLETSTSIILAVLVSLFAGTLLQLESMQSPFYTILMAFVITTCQFTLLKVSTS